MKTPQKPTFRPFFSKKTENFDFSGSSQRLPKTPKNPKNTPKFPLASPGDFPLSSPAAFPLASPGFPAAKSPYSAAELPPRLACAARPEHAEQKLAEIEVEKKFPLVFPARQLPRGVTTASLRGSDYFTAYVTAHVRR